MGHQQGTLHELCSLDTEEHLKDSGHSWPVTMLSN